MFGKQSLHQIIQWQICFLLIIQLEKIRFIFQKRIFLEFINNLEKIANKNQQNKLSNEINLNKIKTIKNLLNIKKNKIPKQKNSYKSIYIFKLLRVQFKIKIYLRNKKNNILKLLPQGSLIYKVLKKIYYTIFK